MRHYTSAQAVTITSTTSGASIRYTTDGSTPSATVGTVYSAPVSIGTTATLKAIAYKTGYSNSSVTSGAYTINLTAAAPTFSPVAGTFTSPQTVTIASTTSGASIRYTTDGSTPTATTGTIYSSPVNIGATATLKAIAYLTGYTNSTVTSGSYTINLPTATAPTFSPAAGTYTSVQTVTITSSTSGATIRYTTDGSTPSATVGTIYSTAVSIPSTATLKAIAYKTGYTNSSVASATYTITLPTAVAPVFSPVAGSFTSAQTVTITSATSGASIRYTTDGSTPSATAGTVYSAPVNISATKTLKAITYLTGYNNSTVTSGTYTINLPKAATPSYSPGAGTYSYIQTVTITTTTSGALIAYTTDGTTPTESGGTITHGTLYTDPVNINATTTLKAIAFASGYADSSVKSGTYTLNLPAAVAPVFYPAPGTYASGQNVVIVSPEANNGVMIAYTTDGSTPTAGGGVITHGTQYTGPLVVGSTITIKAICYMLGYSSSPVVSGTYTIATAAGAPTFSPAPGTYSNSQNVSINSATSGASIMYTTDGSTPTETHGTLYSGPVSLSSMTMLKAIAYVTGSAGYSSVARGLYTIGAPAPVLDVLHDFTPSDQGGTNPEAGLVRGLDGNFYGMAQGDGNGTIYKITPTGDFGTLVSFSGVNGNHPNGRLALGSDGNFYGTTVTGGRADSGTVFKMTPAGALTTLYEFAVPHNVSYPSTGLVQGYDGNFYGSTEYGGILTPVGYGNQSSYGTLYKITPAGSLTVLAKYSSSVGLVGNAASELIQARNGCFYGTGYAEGSRLGAIMGWSSALGIWCCYNFYNESIAAYPYAGLVQGSDDNLYGTTSFGGANGAGTVFRVGSGGFSILATYSGLDGASPWADMIQGWNGNFYGTTEAGGSAELGTIFKITSSGTLTSLFSFQGPNGSKPLNSGVLQGGAGLFYGVTWYGGIYDKGTVYRLIVPTVAAPVFSPMPATYLANPQPVTVTSGTPGATIYYTTDGSTPSLTNGTIYSGPISFGPTTILKAIASAAGLDDSAISSGTFSVVAQVATPVFSPGAGTYFGPQAVAITSNTPGATIRYTTDGSMPSETNGTIYTGPIAINTTTTLRAVAYKTDFPNSEVLTGVILINQTPVITPAPSANGSIFGSSDRVTLTFNANDSDGAVSKVEVYRNGSLIATLTSPSVGSSWIFTESSSLPCGSYTYSAIAYDIQGTSTPSGNITVSVVTKLPYMADFETGEGYNSGSLDQQLNWRVTAGTAQITASAASHGTQSVVLDPGSSVSKIEQVFSIRGVSDHPLFIDFYVKPVVGSIYDCDFGRVAFVLDGTVGRFQVFAGDQLGGGVWKPLPLAPAVALDVNHVAVTWQRLTLRLGFPYDMYDVYLNGKMVAGELYTRIRRTATDALRFTVQGVATASSALDDLYVGTDNPLFVDTNNNGIDDVWETACGLSLDPFYGQANRSSDEDGDRLNNVQEYCAGTDPKNTDTDGDGITDGVEIEYGLNPLVKIADDPRAQADDDGDGLSNYEELNYHTNSNKADTDGDGMPDKWEIQNGLPANDGSNRLSDTDGDGRTDLQEYQAGTNPADYYNGDAPPSPVITQIANVSFSVKLEWSPLPHMGPAVYEIERKDGVGAYTKVGEVAKLVAYIDRSVVDGQSYTYRVRVRTTGAWSPYSNEVLVTTQAFPRNGLNVWLDANTCTPGAVSSWTDRNDPMVKAQQMLAARQPVAIAGVLNGYSVVRFDGVDDSLSLTNAMSGATAGEILGVVRVTTLSGTVVNRLWSFGTGSGSSYYNSSRYEDFGTNEDNPHTGSPLSDQYHITDVSVVNATLCERANGVVNWRRDGVAIAFNSAPVIGGSLSDSNTVFKGDIAELLVYNRELTPEERGLISEYLVAKYALESVPEPASPYLWADVNSNHQVTLSWSSPPATLYTTTLVERSTESGEFVVLAQLEQGATYVDTPVMPGGRYSYRVRTKGLAGSKYSNTVSLIVPVSTTVIATVDGSSMTAVSGKWRVDGTSLIAQSIRGAVDYNLQVNTAGLYELDIIVRDAYESNLSSEFELDVLVDGIALRTLKISTSGTQSGTGSLILPWLTVGVHSVKLVWHNGRLGTLLRVDSVQLKSFDSADINNNGVPDWMEPYLASTFAFDETPVQSYVSPYTVEGKSAYPLFVKLSRQYQTIPASTEAALSVRQGLSTQFYADVPLSTSASAKISAFEANGLKIGTKIVTWKPLNLVGTVSSTMTVRKDSRLLVEASDSLTPNTTYQLRVVTPDGGVVSPSLEPSQKLEVLFDQVGDYQIYLTPAGGTEVKALRVTVLQLSLSPVPVLFVGSARSVRWGNLPSGPVIQADPTMSVTTAGLWAGAQNFTITASSASRAVLRLEGETGQIVDAVTVDPIRSYNDEQSTGLLVSTLPDGTTIYRFSIDFDGPIPADLRVVLRPFVGATFSDGSIEKTITASDIGLNGRFEYYIYVKKGNTATCHNASVYVGTDELYYY